MDFSTLQSETAARLGVFDLSVSDDLVKIKRWLNMAQQEICQRHPWPFLITNEIVQTSTDITTGTVTISNGSSSLTFSDAPSVSVANWFIQFSTSSNWYQVTAHTAASTSATINPASGEGSDITAGTYKLRKLFYKTSTPLDSVLDMKQLVTPTVVKSISPMSADVFLSLYWDAGTVYSYVMSSFSATDGLQFSFVYSPSSVINVMVRGIQKLSDMSASTDVSVIPSRWHSALVDLACHYGFLSIDDARDKISYERAMNSIDEMRRVYNPDMGRHRIMRAIDEGVQANPVYTLPSDYGPTL